MRNDLDGSLNQPDDHQQNEKNGGRLAICAVRPANRSKKVVLGVRDRMGATDSGPVIDRRGARWRENWNPWFEALYPSVTSFLCAANAARTSYLASHPLSVCGVRTILSAPVSAACSKTS
jgi:hypothetical protein